MKTFKCVLAAAAATLAVCAAGAASASIVTGANFGTIGAPGVSFGPTDIPQYNTNSYAYYFSTLSAWDAIFSMQAQNSAADPIQFVVQQLVGVNYVNVPGMQSSDAVGAIIPSTGSLFLAAGSYRLLTEQIGIPPNVPDGYINGAISLSAVPGVPEPATWAMMLIGLGGLGAALRMSRRKTGAGLAGA